ncbi:hypothetical protein [Oceaniglobus roseus]|uniref:hypothetical protein n=1 Tax=Oceaniglobus roseus TaxID=1737570 RepID=UPI000C7F2035|nr:hypothetical protein [Kandeliimicrobium roseum]
MDLKNWPRGVRAGALALGAVALAGCVNNGTATPGGGTGGGGGGTPPATPATYQANLDAVQALVPTSDMPVSGSATYTGATRLDIVQGGTGELYGDVSFDVDFAAANNAAISNGVANNWRGTVDGQAVAFNGELRTGPKYPSSFNNDEQPIVAPPGVILPPGTPTSVRPGSASIALYGDIDDANAGNSEVLLTLGGNFTGPQGQAIHGPAQIQQITGTSVAERAGAGTWYAER